MTKYLDVVIVSALDQVVATALTAKDNKRPWKASGVPRRAQGWEPLEMRIKLFKTAENLPDVEVHDGDALIVSVGTCASSGYRVVISPQRMHVIDDSEGKTIFEWPSVSETLDMSATGDLTKPISGEPKFATQTYSPDEMATLILSEAIFKRLDKPVTVRVSVMPAARPVNG